MADVEATAARAEGELHKPDADEIRYEAKEYQKVLWAMAGILADRGSAKEWYGKLVHNKKPAKGRCQIVHDNRWYVKPGTNTGEWQCTACYKAVKNNKTTANETCKGAPPFLKTVLSPEKGHNISKLGFRSSPAPLYYCNTCARWAQGHARKLLEVCPGVNPPAKTQAEYMLRRMAKGQSPYSKERAKRPPGRVRRWARHEIRSEKDHSAPQ